MACALSVDPSAALGLPPLPFRGRHRPPLSLSSPFLRPNSSLKPLPVSTLPSAGIRTLVAVPRAVLDPGSLDAVGTASHNLLLSLADAAADVTAAVQAADAGQAASTSSGGWFAGLADILENVLKVLEQGLTAIHVPYAYGFSIILLTFLVKALTYPLTKKQVESTLSMQSLAPKLKTIQAKFAGDQERIQLETARLYKQAGVNPLAGCLPTLATLPVWIGLYQALSNVAKEGVLTEGFFWIPSLAGPASLAARDNGSGTSWLFNWVDGTPPLGWGETVAYLVLPVLLVASQYYSMQILQPPTSDDPAQKNTQLILKFLPIMIGWFALSVPSGLSLYWFTNNILSTAQTVYLRKLGGATPVITADQVGEIIDVGQAKRTSANIATKEDADRGERFRRLKELEAERKAARRAAEETARAAAVQAAKERAELVQQQSAPLAASAPSAADQVIDTELVGHEGEEEDEDEAPEESATPGAPAKVPVTTNGTARPASKRSKRSRRSR